MGIPRFELAGCQVESKQLLSPGGVGVSRALYVAIYREVRVQRDAIEQELRLVIDELAVSADIQRGCRRFERLHVAREHSLPLAVSEL